MAGAVDHTVKIFSLNTGQQMPGIGLGTFRIRTSSNMKNAVDAALSAGYRLFDTAAAYKNEYFLGEAFKALLPKHDLDRDDIFVTTKIAPCDHGGNVVVSNAYRKSLQYLDLDYVDMLLIHFPGTAKMGTDDPRNKELRHSTWEALCELHENGVVNGIGVSNFTVTHLKDLMAAHPSKVPAINQVEFHPYYQQKELIEFCKQHDIVVQAYSSLGGLSTNIPNLYKDPLIKRIADSLEVSISQVLLAWALQQDVAIIPKSANPLHIKENINLNFRIPQDYMRKINRLSITKTFKYAWDPSVIL